jgi:hypothetical protein
MNINIETLTNLFELHHEWLLVHTSGKTFYLRSNEMEIERSRDKILFGFLDEKGFQTWRVTEASVAGDKISFRLTRNFGTEKTKLELVPRTGAEVLGEAVELARIEIADRIARTIAAEFENVKLRRVGLNKENGRFAQILLEHKDGRQTSVLADVSDSLDPEVLLSAALLRLEKLARRRKEPVAEIWILSEKRVARNLQKLHACLRDDRKKKIRIKEFSRRGAKEQSEKRSIRDLKSLAIESLWTYKPATPKLSETRPASGISREIIELAPESIDRLFTANGETLRYKGLPFVRVRRVLEEEKAWFGIERERRILNEDSYEDFYELFETLERYRRFDSPNKQHAFYREAPEAWLESLFRQNIKMLDANLILSPIHNQFRTSRDRIDLLALRRDGRLVIIELKVAADREMIFQAVDYWRKIELRRRKGDLVKAKIFGSRKIAEKPAIIYLVAPTMSFHRNFDFLAAAVAEEIEIYRFDLAENWRENLKVLGRRKTLKGEE